MEESRRAHSYFSGWLIGHARTATRSYRGGRACAQPECHIRLSIYKDSTSSVEPQEKLSPRIRGPRVPRREDRLGAA